MNKDIVIKVENVSKKFCRSLRRSMAYGTIDLFRNLFGLPTYNGNLRKGEFWSLNNINFEIKKGEAFGLVGANGSGKTTLLRLINGIFPPDRGKISIKGRIGALIAVGAGFHPHMTGRENIYLNGTILGMSKKEIKENFDSIVDFADIGEFLDAPVSTYSSGMYVRLGFAIAIHCRPDIVLVDEILAVGDAKFQRKCLDKLQNLRKNGASFVLVSHNMDNIDGICDRAILLDNGEQKMIGDTKDVIPAFELLLQTGKFYDTNNFSEEKFLGYKNNTSLKLVKKYNGFGTDEIQIIKVCITNKDGSFADVFLSEEPIKITLDIRSEKDLERLTLWSVFIYVANYKSDEGNINCIGIRKSISVKKGLSKIIIEYPMLGLTTGEYKVSFRFYDESLSNPYTHGHYGYFRFKKKLPTLMKVGISSPLIWVDNMAKVEIKSI